MSEPIPVGSRNQTLYQLGCKLRRAGATPSEILVVLLDRNEESCTPPLGREEVWRISVACGKIPADRDQQFVSVLSNPHGQDERPYATDNLVEFLNQLAKELSMGIVRVDGAGFSFRCVHKHAGPFSIDIKPEVPA